MADYAAQFWQPTGNGDWQPFYMDLQTGAQLSPEDLPFYQVADQQQIESGAVKLPEEAQKNYQEMVYQSGGNHQAPEGGSVAGPRSMSNNFGYASKPGWMGLASMAPGPAGLAMKAGSLAMNVNNRQAIQDARQTIGLEHKNNFGSFINDQKGLVGNVNFANPQNPDQNETVPVGFEAQDKYGRTMMTPNEARNRALANPGTMTEATPQDVKDAAANFKAQGLEPQKAQSIGSKMLGNMFGTHYNTNPTDKTNHIQTGITGPNARNLERAVQSNEVGPNKGQGLMDLSPSFKNSVENGTHVNPDGSIAGANYAHPERGAITAGLTDRTKEAIGALAANTPGGINVSSAYRSPAVNAAVRGAAQSYHQTGQAFDVSTKGLTDQQKQDLTERAIMSGAMEIGTYGDQSLHVATDRRNPMNASGVAAMYNRTEKNALQNAPGWFTAGVTESRLAPTPQTRPTQVEQDLAAAPNSFVGQERMAAPTGSFAGQERLSQPNDIAQASAPSNISAPASGSMMDRYNAFSADDRKAMAMTLAGEIDPSKTKIGTEDFTNEAHAITSTIDNRVDKYGSVAGVLGSPKQYSTWNNTAAANTAINNYNKNPEAYDNAVRSYYADDKNKLGFTNYHASYVNPGWSKDMKDVQAVGAHIFGTLPGYAPAAPQTPEVGPTPVARPDLSVSATPQSFAQSAPQQTDHFQGPTQVGSPGDNKSDKNDNSSSSGSSSTGGNGGNRGSTGGGFASAAQGGATGSGLGGNSSGSSNSSNSSNGGRSGYGGSRSDGWN